MRIKHVMIGWIFLAFAHSVFGQDQGVLLLKNGRTIKGAIFESADGYAIRPRQGIEFQLAADEVDSRCRNLEEVFLLLKQRLGSEDLQGELALTHWTLDNGLTSLAQAQLEHLQQLRCPKNQLNHIQSRLRMLADNQANSQPVADHTKRTSAEPATIFDRIAAEQIVIPPIKKELYFQFTSKVQPKLLQNCSTTGCHSFKDRSAFRLYCEAPSRPVSERMSQFNLSALIKQIDLNQIDRSPILHYASNHHGKMDRPPLRQGSDELQALLTWIQAYANEGDSPSTTRSVLPANTSGSRVFDEGERQTPLDADSLATEFLFTPPVLDRLGDYQPKDPFDGEAFNRLMRLSK